MKYLTSTIAASIMVLGAGAAWADLVPGETFVQKAAGSDMFEIESSKIALKKSSDTNVKKFAQAMVTDHGKASAKLKTAAAGDGVKLPTAMDAEHKGMIDQLNAAPANAFDSMYVQMQTKGHQEAVALFTDYAQQGDKPKLKQFASATLPTLKMHLDHVTKLSPKSPASGSTAPKS